MNGSSTVYPASMSRIRSGSKSSVPAAQGMAREGSGGASALNAAYLNGWRPSGTPSPSAGLGITSPTSSYMQARHSPIGPPPREALPSLPDSAYEDALEQGTSTNGYSALSASGVQAMAASRPGTMLWDGQQAPVLPHPFAQEGQEEDRFSTARTTMSRRVMGSSPPQTGAYSRSAIQTNASARPQSQYQQIDAASDLPQRSAVPINRQPRQAGTSSPPSAHSSPKLGASTSSVSATRESEMSSETTSTLQPSASIRERRRSAGTSATASTSAAAGSGSADALPSKSVLTIALQKAQTAVELDQQGSEEAAVAAYIHSVRLLKEVMTRVEESATAWRQREVEKLQLLQARKQERRRVRQEASGSSGYSGPAYQSEDDETHDERREREKREAKLEKRERMRLDESRRLRVIHDTYEERIRVLNADLAERARIDQLSAEASARAATASHAASSDQSGARDLIYSITPSRPSISSERSESSATAGIGRSMLTATPMSPSAAARQAATVINTSPRSTTSSKFRVSAVPFPDSPTHQRKRSEDLIAQLGLSASGSYTSLAVTAGAAPVAIQPTTFGALPNFRSTELPAKSEKRKSRTKTPSLSHIVAEEEKSMLSFSPDSDTSSSAAVFEGQQTQFPASYASHRKNLSSVSSGGRSKHSPSSSSNIAQFSTTADAEEEKEIEELYRDAQTSVDGEERDGPPSELATPTPDSTFRGAFASTNGSRASASTFASSSGTRSAEDIARSRAGSQASSATGQSSLRHMTSNESLSSIGSSAFAHMAKMPVPPIPSQQAQASGSRASQVTRQTRSASLAAHTAQQQQQQAGHRATSSAGKNSLLVNPTTSQGTISQRRKSPQIPENAIMESTGSQESDRGSVIAPSDGNGAFNAAGSLPMRLRALSQPGSKRPALQSYNSEYAALPSVPPLPIAPTMMRADSDPTNPRDPSTPASGTSSGSKVSPPSLVIPTSASSISQDVPQSASFIEPETPMSTSFLSITPAPSSTAFSGGSNPSSSFLAPSANEFHPPPRDPTRRPYHFLRQLRASIQSGAYLTPRLYIPKQLWQQGSVKLIHIETKVRMLDLLLNGLEGIERLGDGLLADSTKKAANKSSRIDAASRLSKELESFEGMLDGIQSTLSKKLGYIEAPGGKKGGQSSFGAWSSKLSRSMDRMTKGKNLDAPETYVAAIARLCLHVQILDRHVSSLHASTSPSSDSHNGISTSSVPMTKSSSSASTLHPQSGKSETTASAAAGYADLSPEMQKHLDAKLRRTTEFFEKTVCRMILVDLGIWLEKYSKRAAGWTTD